MTQKRGSAGPRLVVAAAVGLGSTAALALLLGSLDRVAAAGLRTVDDVVTVSVHAVGAVVLLWYLATAVVAACCLVARAAGGVWVGAERRLSTIGAPLVRRLLVAGTGALVAATAVLAPASATPNLDETGLSDDLGWGATDSPAAPTTDPAEPSTEPGPTTDPADPGTPPPSDDDEADDADDPSTAVPAADTTSGSNESASYAVVAGDSLWAIAAEHLPGEPDDAEIAAAWPLWFDTNRDVIGDDPDLIHPGQVLSVPDHDPEEHA